MFHDTALLPGIRMQNPCAASFIIVEPYLARSHQIYYWLDIGAIVPIQH